MGGGLHAHYRPQASHCHFPPREGSSCHDRCETPALCYVPGCFDYKIKYKSTTEHCNADGLSRLPLQHKEREEMEVDSSEMFHATQFETLPVTSEAVAREIRRDPVLARVYESIVKGWSARVGGDKPYYEQRNELTVHQDCILWGMRVVIPNKLQVRVLEELHDGHLGVVKMKALARSYVWWPNISGQLEELAKACSGVSTTKRCLLKHHCIRGSGPLHHGNAYTSTMPAHFRTRCS